MDLVLNLKKFDFDRDGKDVAIILNDYGLLGLKMEEFRHELSLEVLLAM